MPKSWFVARREFVENLRTKTFWIGIFIFPVLLTLSFIVPVWLSKTKDVRRYVVLDHSGWLLQEVEKRAAFPDLLRILVDARQRLQDGASIQIFPQEIQGIVRRFQGLSDTTFRKVMGEFVKLYDPGVDAAAQRQLIQAQLPPAQRENLNQNLLLFSDHIRRWWRGLDPKQARKFGSDLGRSRYLRVQPENLGDKPESVLNRMIDDKRIFAYFVIEKDPVHASSGCRYVSNNQTDQGLSRWFARFVNEIVREKRFQAQGIKKELYQKILAPVVFDEKKVTPEGTTASVGMTDKARQWVPVGFAYMLWIAVFSVAQMLLTNTIEEKSNRIIEVLLSSISPLQLMAGKIAGIAVTGLTILSSWVVFFVLGVKFGPSLLGIEPGIDLSFVLSDPTYLASFLGYFLMGYLFYAAFLVGLGAVCNSLKEAQNLMQPLMLLMILPLLAIVPVAQDPNGTLARLLSWIPPFTPFVMMNRAAAPPSHLEYLGTTLLLLGSIAAAFWGAARIFRIGILMTGKRPSLLQILRWLRSSSPPSPRPNPKQT